MITAGVIKHKVNEGRGQIAEARQGVDAVKRLSNLSEYTAPAGQLLTEHAEKKIHAGERQADSYAVMGSWFMAIGVFLIVIAAIGFLIFWRNG